jgi:hypothetical protein
MFTSAQSIYLAMQFAGHIREVASSDLGLPTLLIEVFDGFPQYLQFTPASVKIFTPHWR